MNEDGTCIVSAMRVLFFVALLLLGFHYFYFSLTIRVWCVLLGKEKNINMSIMLVSLVNV